MTSTLNEKNECNETNNIIEINNVNSKSKEMTKNIEDKLKNVKLDSKEEKILENESASKVDGGNQGMVAPNQIGFDSLPPGYSLSSCAPEATDYNMSHENRGHCLIFNQTVFDSATQLGERSGSNTDRDKVSSLFRSLGFNVVVYNNLSLKGIKQILEKYAFEVDHSECDCFTLIFMSHGEEGLLYGRDAPFKSEDIYSLFTADQCPSLASKPKMFFIQACRGEGLDPGRRMLTHKVPDETDSGSLYVYKIPNHADFLICWSTVPDDDLEHFSFKRSDELCAVNRSSESILSDPIGWETKKEKDSSVECICNLLTSTDTLDSDDNSPCKGCSKGHFSWRNTSNGSWFVQSLVHVFGQSASSLDVLSMMTSVNRHMMLNFESNCPSSPRMHSMKQSAAIVSTLTRLIYLKPKK